MKKAQYTNEMLANYFSGGLVLTDAFKNPSQVSFSSS